MSLSVDASDIVLFFVLTSVIVYVLRTSSSRETRLLSIIDCYSTQLQRIAEQLSLMESRQRNIEIALMAGRGDSEGGINNSGSMTIGRDAMGRDLINK